MTHIVRIPCAVSTLASDDPDDCLAWGPTQDAEAEVRLTPEGTFLHLKLSSAATGRPLVSALSTHLRVCRPKPSVLFVSLCPARGSGAIQTELADELTLCVRCHTADAAVQLAALLEQPQVQPRPAHHHNSNNNQHATPPTGNHGQKHARPAEQGAHEGENGQAQDKGQNRHRHKQPHLSNGTPNGNAHAAPEAAAEVADDAVGSVFEAKTDKGSSEMYFKYYGGLANQQNMLQDYVRTGLYCAAITHNPLDFQGKVVLDVGAGSGVLSLFAAQAGASKVYAVEASNMAKYAKLLAAGNPSLGKVIEVVHGKIEEIHLPDKVDVLISEPMGTLLVNERMLETYLFARDKWLKPGGKMFPHVGRIHVAAFTDEVLHTEIQAKAAFWTQSNFYGIDVTPLHNAAVESYFSQVVVDAIDPLVLVSSCDTALFDFQTCQETQLHDITIPLQLQVTSQGPCTVHGVATWFDVLFSGSQAPVWLSTAPGLPTTHWFQLRCVLSKPLQLQGPGVVTGRLRLVAHRHQSYDIHLLLQAPPLTPGGPPQTSFGMYDLKEPYYRQLTGWYQQQQQQQQQQQPPAGGQAAPPPTA